MSVGESSLHAWHAQFKAEWDHRALFLACGLQQLHWLSKDTELTLRRFSVDGSQPEVPARALLCVGTDYRLVAKIQPLEKSQKPFLRWLRCFVS